MASSRTYFSWLGLWLSGLGLGAVDVQCTCDLEVSGTVCTLDELITL